MIAACLTYIFAVTAANGYGESDYSVSYLVNNGRAPTSLNAIPNSAIVATTGGLTVQPEFTGDFSNGGCELIGVGMWEEMEADDDDDADDYCYTK
jgi:hypothetical protein